MLSTIFRSKSKQERVWDACSYGKEEILIDLIRNGADVNRKSFIYECFPVHVASQGKPAVLKLLLDAGCNLDSLDADGNTALHHAAMSGRLENGIMLLEAGATVSACNHSNWTPLHNSSYWNQPKFIRLLLSKGANPHLKNKSGRTPLHELCRSKSRNELDLVDGATAILDHLLRDSPRTADADLPPVATTTTTNSASHWLDERCECQNDWDCEADFTPLLFAVYHGHLDLVKTLLDYGADIQATTKNGWTALHWAAQRCYADMVELLLERGASWSVEDLRGDLPCDVTNDFGLRECLLPDPVYPNIISNGYATTDEEEEDDKSE